MCFFFLLLMLSHAADLGGLMHPSHSGSELDTQSDVKTHLYVPESGRRGFYSERLALNSDIINRQV